MRPLIAERAPSPRRDPAPSRWAYRWNRLWLTPLFRAVVRVGVPAFVVAFGTGLWLSDEGRRDALAGAYGDVRDGLRTRPELMVSLVQIDGTSPVLAETLRGALQLELPVSSLALNLDGVRRQVEAFDAVARADLRVLPSGTLQIAVIERLPAVVWRTADGLWLLDETGHRVATIGARALRADLPLVVGDGADAATPEALELIAAAGPLMPRLRGLVRMGERRWDVVLDRDQRLLLPEQEPVRALERIIALDAAEPMLARDITAIDLRNPRRLTLRLTADAADTLRQIKLTQSRGARP